MLEKIRTACAIITVLLNLIGLSILYYSTMVLHLHK